MITASGFYHFTFDFSFTFSSLRKKNLLSRRVWIRGLAGA